jgi:hypothetical protein
MLTAVVASAAAEPGIEVFYYVVGSVIAIGGVAIGGARLLMWLRSRWTREGEQRAASSKVIEDNTKAALANTAAIGELGAKLDRFAEGVHDQFDQVHAELNGHGAKIARLEMQQGIGPSGPNGSR